MSKLRHEQDLLSHAAVTYSEEAKSKKLFPEFRVRHESWDDKKSWCSLTETIYSARFHVRRNRAFEIKYIYHEENNEERVC